MDEGIDSPHQEDGPKLCAICGIPLLANEMDSGFSGRLLCQSCNGGVREWREQQQQVREHATAKQGEPSSHKPTPSSTAPLWPPRNIEWGEYKKAGLNDVISTVAGVLMVVSVIGLVAAFISLLISLDSSSEFSPALPATALSVSIGVFLNCGVVILLCRIESHLSALRNKQG